MKTQLVLLYSIVALSSITNAKPSCNDECGLQKAESSLKLALGILKLVKDDNSTTSNNGDNDKNPSTTSAWTPWSTTTGTADSMSIEIHRSTPIPTSTPSPINNECNQTINSLPATCADILVAGYYKSGIYTIYPRWQKEHVGVKVYCDHFTQGGGWTLIQRRNDYKQNQSFNQTFDSYAKGFGSLLQEFWIGNELIHILTTQERMILRIDLEDWDGQNRFAHYQNFMVADEDSLFLMTFQKYFDSTAGNDALGQQNGRPFSTYDKDTSSSKPARVLGGGSWFPNLGSGSVYANLNGIYYPKGQHLAKPNGTFWSFFGGYSSLKKVEMKLRPEYFVSPPRDL